MASKPRRDASPYLAGHRTLASLQEASRGCRGCDRYARATQTVFGEGSPSARIVVVGEQPGDQEDLTGHPFVGPAGRILSRVLAEAGLSRGEIYVTNAVKHFGWLPRGKRRLHQRPPYAEVMACKPWLSAELAAIRPIVIVCLGATAAQSFFGSSFRIRHALGRAIEDQTGRTVVTTHHPASILRIPDADERDRARCALVGALVLARRLADGRA